MLQMATVQEKTSSNITETEPKTIDTVISVTCSVTSTNSILSSSRTGAFTQLVSSNQVAPTPRIVSSQVTSTSIDVAQQREQSRVDALRAAANLHGPNGTISPSQMTVTTTSEVVSGLNVGETEDFFPQGKYL